MKMNKTNNMKPHTRIPRAALAALCIFSLSPALLCAADTTQPAVAHGIIKSVDMTTHTLVVTEHKSNTELTFQWNDQTQFTERGQSATASALKEGERVQVTTSAAWYWLLAAVNLPLHHVLATAIVVTTLLFVALLALVRRIYGDTPALWFLLVSFLLSKGFFDFTSSGHENILAYTVLLALYATYRQTVSPDPAPPRQLYLIAALTGLVPVVRHDLSLLCVLPFAWLLWRERHHWRRAVVLIALAGLPLLLWTIASLVYYGLPFPNTAYAKVLKHGFAANIMLKMGLDYFYCNGRHDPLTMQVIAVAPVVALWKLQSWQRAFALGVVVYCLYLCKIGGDYFAGRFLSVPFLVAALLVADWLQSLKLPRAAAWTARAGGWLWKATSRSVPASNIGITAPATGRRPTARWPASRWIIFKSARARSRSPWWNWRARSTSTPPTATCCNRC